MLLGSLLHLDRIYTYTLIGVQVLTMLAKLISLPYPAGVWVIEFLVIVLYWLFSEWRLNAGRSANKLESGRHAFLMIIFACVCVVGNVIMMELQTYV